MGGRCTKPETDVEGGGVGVVGPGGKRAESSGAAARQFADGVRGADPGSPSSHRGSRRASADGPSGRGGASSGPGGGGGASSSFRSLGGASSASYSSMPGVHSGVPAPFSFAGGDGRPSSAGAGTDRARGGPSGRLARRAGHDRGGGGDLPSPRVRQGGGGQARRGAAHVRRHPRGGEKTPGDFASERGATRSPGRERAARR